MNQNMLRYVLLGLIVILLVGCTSNTIQPYTNTSNKVTMINTTNSTYNSKNVFGGVNRERYNITQEVFQELPQAPSDLLSMREAMKTQRLLDLCDITSDYYLQPELYPNFDVDPLGKSKFGSGVNWFQKNDSTRWGVIGYGVYPSDIYIQTSKEETFSSCMFLHTSWGIETYQGTGISYTFPEISKDENGLVVNTQNSTITSQYIQVLVEPKDYLLTPTYPVFSKDWATKVKFNINIAKNTPSGVYVVALTLGKPSYNKGQEWVKQYLGSYIPSGGMYGMDRPMYRVFIEVN